MQEVKRIFNEKYHKCDIEQLPQYSRGEYKLGSIENPIVYSTDCIFHKYHRARRGRRCDEFVFFSLSPKSTGIYLVERKNNHANNINQVKEQLQGGARFIEAFLEDDPATDRQPFDFMPVWVSNSKGIKPTLRLQLKKAAISLRKNSKLIKHINTKGTLPKLKSHF